MSTIQIFDPAQIESILRRAGIDLEFPPCGSANEDYRFRFLHSLAVDPRLGCRNLLLVDAAILIRLQALATAAPNFADAIGAVIRAANLSFLGSSPLALPPILLLGPPGIGKSFFAR
jgi:ATP-dependent Lon protease